MSFNFYEVVSKDKKTININPNYAKHGIKIPFMMCISGPTGSGKSNAVLNLLLQFNRSFHEIIYCIKSADEPLLKHLEEKVGAIICEGADSVPPLSNFSIQDPVTGRLKRTDNLQRLIIFDDLILEKNANKTISEYFIKARKLNISCIKITQSYYQIPKLIRDNCKYFILTRNLLKKDLKMIFNIFPSKLTADEFYNLYMELTKDKLNFILLDIETRVIKKNIIEEKYEL